MLTSILDEPSDVIHFTNRSTVDFFLTIIKITIPNQSKMNFKLDYDITFILKRAWRKHSNKFATYTARSMVDFIFRILVDVIIGNSFSDSGKNNCDIFIFR